MSTLETNPDSSAESTDARVDTYQYVLRQADNAMILCQRLCGWVANAPELEEDVALANIGLDLIGQARSLYQYAAELSEQPTTEDDLVFMRNERDWVNVQLVEQPNGNFADTIARQAFFDIWHLEFLTHLAQSTDKMLAAVAAKSVKEVSYHVRHSSSWVRRLGDGTAVSKERMQHAVNEMWPFTYEMFESDSVDARMVASGVGVDLSQVKTQWEQNIANLFHESKLEHPGEMFPVTGGRKGIHSQHMGYLLAEMQILPRSMPGCEW